MANSTALTSKFDRRNLEPHVQPVWEYVVTFTIEADGGSSELSHTLDNLNGLLTDIIVESGAAGGISGTFGLAIDDNRDNEIFVAASPATPAEGANARFPVDITVRGDLKIQVNPSDDPTVGQADWEIVVTVKGI